ncbi:mevalonate kinase [Streptobacillus canis]|uniref:mevalonate kinase n=1 Tax=Streptobacillus canis TaxID=2678686 RepID=UPI0012E28CC9|nr:mevalonate kinase [Streptobacillus canis]
MVYGKIILFGEHSVVYGKNAIAMLMKGVNLKAEIILKKVKESKHVSDIKEYIKSKYGIEEDIYIDIISTIPSGSGLGSSAALAIAIAKAFKKKYGLNKEDVKNIVWESERRAHGNPSGIDIAVILNNENVLFNKQDGVRKIEFNLGAKLVIANSGLKGVTREAVAMVAENYDEFKVYIDNLGDIANKAIKALEEKDIFFLGELMNLAQVNLKSMNLSNDKLEKLINVAKNNSLGAKITGAGLGGCIISLVKTKDEANYLKKLLIKEGAKNVWLEDI